MYYHHICVHGFIMHANVHVDPSTVYSHSVHIVYSHVYTYISVVQLSLMLTVKRLIIIHTYIRAHPHNNNLEIL